MKLFGARTGLILIALILVGVAFMAMMFKGSLRSSPQGQDSPETIKTAIKPPAPSVSAEIIATFPHGPMAYTQGLAIVDGILYESIGLPKPSVLRRQDLDTGEILNVRSLPEDLFAEGIAVVGDYIVQLTWKKGVGIVYNRHDLQVIGSFRYQGEGWGLTYDGVNLILSDGTSTLRLINPNTYQEVGRISVTYDNRPMDRLNELEYIRGEVWANVYEEDFLVRIDPSDGRVTGSIDLSELYPAAQRSHPFAVPNGIAFDSSSGRLFVTGKVWPKMFEIKMPYP